MANVKVYNPHARLINVAQKNGKFVRIPPLQSAEVEEESLKGVPDGYLTRGDAPTAEAAAAPKPRAAARATPAAAKQD